MNLVAMVMGRAMASLSRPGNGTQATSNTTINHLLAPNITHITCHIPPQYSALFLKGSKDLDKRPNYNCGFLGASTWFSNTVSVKNTKATLCNQLWELRLCN